MVAVIIFLYKAKFYWLITSMCRSNRTSWYFCGGSCYFLCYRFFIWDFLHGKFRQLSSGKASCNRVVWLTLLINDYLIALVIKSCTVDESQFRMDFSVTLLALCQGWWTTCIACWVRTISKVTYVHNCDTPGCELSHILSAANFRWARVAREVLHMPWQGSKRPWHCSNIRAVILISHWVTWHSCSGPALVKTTQIVGKKFPKDDGAYHLCLCKT